MESLSSSISSPLSLAALAITAMGMSLRVNLQNGLKTSDSCLYVTLGSISRLRLKAIYQARKVFSRKLSRVKSSKTATSTRMLFLSELEVSS